MLHDEPRPCEIHVDTAICHAIGPGRDHEPDDIADQLWHQHLERDRFQTRFGIN